MTEQNRRGLRIITGSAKLPGDYAPLTQADAMGRKAELRARGRVRKRSGEMNKTEAAFSVELGNMRHAGLVLWFAFEPLKLRLADNTFFTPDFAVLYADGLLQLIDCKGTTKKDGKYKPFTEEDARLKIKVCAELFPVSVAVAYRLPLKAGGGWKIEEV